MIRELSNKFSFVKLNSHTRILNFYFPAGIGIYSERFTNIGAIVLDDRTSEFSSLSVGSFLFRGCCCWVFVVVVFVVFLLCFVGFFNCLLVLSLLLVLLLLLLLLNDARMDHKEGHVLFNDALNTVIWRQTHDKGQFL